MDFGPEPRSHNGTVTDKYRSCTISPCEILDPLLVRSGLAVDPVEMRLQVAVRTGDVPDLDGEKDVAIVAGPMQLGFGGLVVG